MNTPPQSREPTLDQLEHVLQRLKIPAYKLRQQMVSRKVRVIPSDVWSELPKKKPSKRDIHRMNVAIRKRLGVA
jgi:hypothetical protein